VFQYTFVLFSDSTDNRTVTFRLPLDAALTLIQASATGSGTCSNSDTTASCTLTIRQGAPMTVAVQAMLKPDTAPGTLIRVVASAEDDLHTRRTAAVTVRATSTLAAPTARPVVATATPTPAPTVTPGGGHGTATLTPIYRQWVAPGGSARFTIRLAANARGFWIVAVTPSDPRLTVTLNGSGGQLLSCQATAAGLLCLGIPGSTTTLQLTVATSADSLGLLGEVTLAVGDSDAGGSGLVVANLHALIGVGDAPTATPLQPTAIPGGGPGRTPNCAPLPLVRLPNVTAPQPRLVAPAAESFAAVRAEIVQRTGIDALAVLADVLRAPSFSTTKAGVLNTSWHKAGRAVDVNQGGPFVRVAEGSRFRLYVNNVDITAIFEAHGWQRIPVQGTTLEWWHYEWHPDGIAWTSAMLQVWDLPTLQAAFPDINWTAIGCAGGSNTGSGDLTVSGQEREELCVLGTPRYGSPIETFDGCGPPVRAGDKVYQLDTTLGFVGLSGQSSGPHLHLGLKVKRYDGSWPIINICTPEWLDGRGAPAGANCYTDMADPLAFLPQAPGNATIAGGDGEGALRQSGPDAGGHGARTPTPLIPEGAPYQLPPPNFPGSLVFTPVPGATPIGQYWSPYADGGQYGGGGGGQWFCSNVDTAGEPSFRRSWCYRTTKRCLGVSSL
jgi:hypothetical protein